jgi:hypothetical protein
VGDDGSEDFSLVVSTTAGLGLTMCKAPVIASKLVASVIGVDRQVAVSEGMRLAKMCRRVSPWCGRWVALLMAAVGSENENGKLLRERKGYGCEELLF